MTSFGEQRPRVFNLKGQLVQLQAELDLILRLFGETDYRVPSLRSRVKDLERRATASQHRQGLAGHRHGPIKED